MTMKLSLVILFIICFTVLQIFLSTRSNKRWGALLPLIVLVFGIIQMTLTGLQYEDYCQRGGSASLFALILFDVYTMLIPLSLLGSIYLVSRKLSKRKELK